MLHGEISGKFTAHKISTTYESLEIHILAPYLERITMHLRSHWVTYRSTESIYTKDDVQW